MAFVYLLECADGTLYTGWTKDLRARVARHNRGSASRYTRCRLPVRLVYWEQLGSPSQAQRREASLRRMRRADKLSLVAAACPSIDP